MDAYNFIVYSYHTGKFYLVNINSISSTLKDKINNIDGKICFLENEMHEIIKKAQNPNCVDYSQFQYPIVVGLMTTNRCNLTCRYCIANNGESYSVNDNFSIISTHLLNELKNSSVISVMVSGGEPTLYKNLPWFLSELSQNEFLILLDTNGTLIKDELLDVIKTTSVIPRISLDSIYKNEHDFNRGMFNDTLSNIIKMRNMNIDLRINTVLNKSNAKNLNELAKWLCKNGITKWHIFKLQQAFAPPDIWLGDYETIDVLSNIQKIYGKDIDILYKFSKNNDGFASFVIDSEGNCFSTQTKEGYNKKYFFGNIAKKSLKEIWRSTPMDFKLNHYNKYLSYTNKEL